MPGAPIKAEVLGVRELQTGARRLFGNIDDRAEAEFRSTADQVATLVRGKVPHRTGQLAASVDAEGIGHGAAVGYGVVYAGPVDFGGYPGSRPYYPTGRYLFPTAESAEDQFERAGEHAAVSEIRRMVWPRPGPF